MPVCCRGGVGRAGTIAACVLLALREVTNATDAIKLVRPTFHIQHNVAQCENAGKSNHAACMLSSC